MSRIKSGHTISKERIMTHSGTWAAVDKIAATLGLSCSGLAKKCGMDPTAFNKSKRFSKYGKPHWPSGNTLSKIAAVAHLSPEEFGRIMR